MIAHRLLFKTLRIALLFLALLPGTTPVFSAVTIKDRIDIGPAWAGHWVGFALFTDAAHNRQYAVYYDPERRMTVAARELDSREWTTQTLPSTTGWDSHNYVTLAVDRDGHLHVAGNMHCDPLVYFRTEVVGDIGTLKRIGRMTGNREVRMTYPQFISGNGGELIYAYRDGESGNGVTIFNRYDEKTRTWTRLTDRLLFDGEGKMNAYPIGPVRGPDGFWHMTWVWRDTPDASTNHDLGYARSRDLVNWETVAGAPISLPITINTPGVTLDPVPSGGGIINGTGKIGFDLENRPVIAYHKFDDTGATQIYLARAADGNWKITPITHWTYRWEPSGTGTMLFDVDHSALRKDPKLGLFISLSNAREGNTTRKVDPDTLLLGDELKPDELPDQAPAELRALEGSDPRLQVRLPVDLGNAPRGIRYRLRHEALPINRDQPPEGTVPPPSTLQLIVLENK